MHVTIIRVDVEPEKIEPAGLCTDEVWSRASVDGGLPINLRVTVRKWTGRKNGQGEDTLPIVVYLDGSEALYPTYVYNFDGVLLAFDPGKLYGQTVTS